MTYGNSNPAWERMQRGKAEYEASKRVATCVECDCRVFQNLDGVWSDCDCTRRAKQEQSCKKPTT